MSGRRVTPRITEHPVGGGADPELTPPNSYIAAPSQGDQEVPFWRAEDVAEQEKSEEVEPKATEPEEVSLSDEDRSMFASLLTCGTRSKTLEILGHCVVVQSLCGDDDLRIGLWVKEYQGSLGEQRAYQIGVAAAGLRTVNGLPLITSLLDKPDPDLVFHETVKKVSQMNPLVINQIYRGVMDAEKEFVELAAKLGKSLG